MSIDPINSSTCSDSLYSVDDYLNFLDGLSNSSNDCYSIYGDDAGDDSNNVQSIDQNQPPTDWNIISGKV